MLTTRETAFRRSLLAVDVALAIVLLALTWVALTDVAASSPGGIVVAIGLVALAGGWLIATALVGLHDDGRPWSIGRDARALVMAAAMTGVVGLGIGILLGAPAALLVAIITVPAVLAGAGIAARLALKADGERRRRSGAVRYLLIVGNGDLAVEVAQRVEERWWLDVEIIGYLGDDGLGGGLDASRRLGTVDDLPRILHERVVDDIAVCLAPGDPAIDRVVAIARDEGKTLHLPVSVGPLENATARVDDLGGMTLVSVATGPNQSLSMLVKKGVDVVGAVAGLVLLSPILLGAAIAILLSDGRPILFTQPRAGLNGRPFRIFKFRTMTRDADAQRDELRTRNEISGSASFKLTEDPRVTRVGRILRKTSIDELPQLVNVLRGEMSLVGPRPHPFDDVAGYEPWHRRRLSVKPGITGLWQVKGRLDPTFDHWVQLDLQYIDQWSLWLDIRLILQTVPALLRAEGR